MFRQVWFTMFLCFAGLTAGEDAFAGDLTGTAKDKSGGALVAAKVLVLTAQRAVVATTTTDQNGKFNVAGLPAGEYLIVVQYPSLAERQRAVNVPETGSTAVDVVLEVVTGGDNVTVTADPYGITDAAKAFQPVNVISEDTITWRARSAA